ncbi:Juvenile hormone epoxide hydrolase 1 [Toxocara canis]|uniref:Juvenile hormone epoxide hydrolase 1 n=1 Tax=Toxocara canis TaxID=6265 RepID=A0A0B2VRF6_TOXCA|nr:Juvenile hormone epoxide hydrolase 1 [Toxocara canis]
MMQHRTVRQDVVHLSAKQNTISTLQVALPWRQCAAFGVVVREDDFFGSCNTHADDETISEFSINIDQSAIDNFKEVINRSRSQIVPDLEYSSDVQFGFSTAYLKNVIPILINPNRFGFDFGETTRFAFEVVVPSLPGFAFSDKPSKPGLGVVEAARIMAKLMKRIGFTKYFVHGHGQLGCAIGFLFLFRLLFFCLVLLAFLH